MTAVSFISVSLFALLVLLPPLSIIGVWLWARRLGKRPNVPRFVPWAIYALVIPGTLVTVLGVASGLIRVLGATSGESVDPSQKARVLAEGISEAMNSGACGFLLAVVAALWLGFWAWWWRRREPRPR